MYKRQDQPGIVRLEGKGSGSKELLRINNLSEIESEIISGNNVERIEYVAGNGPISVKIVDPLRVTSGTYQFHICDQNYVWTKDSLTSAYTSTILYTTAAMSDSIYWVLTDVNDPTTIW